MSLPPDVIRQRLLARARLRHWQGFARVAELGSVRKAAEAMAMAQPALTAVLADLEGLLGAALFERHARGMRLTPVGRELLPAARSLLNAVSEAAEQAAALQSGVQGVVRIGAIAGALSGLLSLALPALADRHPGLLVQISDTDAPRLEPMVARGDVDLALCRQPGVVPAGWSFEPLLHDHFLVAASPAHPLAARSALDLDQLRGQTWLALPTGSAARSAFDALFGAAAPPLCQVSCRSPAVLWAMLKARPLLALVPASVARQLLDGGQLIELPITLDLPLPPIGALTPHSGGPAGLAPVLQVLREVAPMRPQAPGAPAA